MRSQSNSSNINNRIRPSSPQQEDPTFSSTDVEAAGIDPPRAAETSLEERRPQDKGNYSHTTTPNHNAVTLTCSKRFIWTVCAVGSVVFVIFLALCVGITLAIVQATEDSSSRDFGGNPPLAPPTTTGGQQQQEQEQQEPQPGPTIEAPPCEPCFLSTYGASGANAQWTICRADPTSAWISSFGAGGTYNGVAICVALGYVGAASFGGTSGRVCGTSADDRSVTGCKNPGTEIFGGFSSDDSACQTDFTVHWLCSNSGIALATDPTCGGSKPVPFPIPLLPVCSGN